MHDFYRSYSISGGFVLMHVALAVARVESSGALKVQFNVTTKNMSTFGYTESNSGADTPLYN